MVYLRNSKSRLKYERCIIFYHKKLLIFLVNIMDFVKCELGKKNVKNDRFFPMKFDNFIVCNDFV